MPSLRALAAVSDCRLVVTQPDRPGGRGQRLRPTPVKEEAQRLGIPTIAPERLRRELVPELFAEPFDLFAVASYGKIVPAWLLDVPRLGALNVHPSLLPLYRGATPLQTQLRDGVVASGVTIILMDAGMDTGDIVLRETAAIGPCETYGELHDRFAEFGAELLGRAVEAARAGELVPTPQSGLAPEAEIAATLTRPLRKEDLRLDSGSPDELTVRGIVDKIRSLARDPGARAEVDLGEQAVTVKVLRAHPLPEGPSIPIPAGSGITKRGWVLIRALDGWVAVDELVIPGSRAMTIEQFRNGYDVTSPLHEQALTHWYENGGEVLLRERTVEAACR